MNDKDLPEKFYTQEYLRNFPEQVANAIVGLPKYKSTKRYGMIEDDWGQYFYVNDVIEALRGLNL